jgi:predicted glycosyltransferase
MNVAYYCQHVLGIGHFHRSMEICKAIARHQATTQTTLILGGPPVEVDQPNIEVLRLPGLQMDSEFNNLVPCRPELSLAEVKTARKDQLFSYFQKNSPDVFITELYPFGRKAFRFELDPLLEAIRDGSLPNCSCYCSVRDILVEKKTGREKFEQRAVQTVNAYFDGILVHADPEIITLNETFGRMADIRTPLHYTGFVTVTQTEARSERERIRKSLGLSPASKLIVASIGGGNVGSELLYAAAGAFKVLEGTIAAHLQLFCGPYCDEKIYKELRNHMQDNITIDRFTDHFPEWLQAADLSISMAGYNTCMNLVQAGIPSLVYPFRQNREQRLRAERLGRKVPMIILEETDLTPSLLSKKIKEHLKSPSMSAAIKLDGAKETAGQIEKWSKMARGARNP